MKNLIVIIFLLPMSSFANFECPSGATLEVNNGSQSCILAGGGNTYPIGTLERLSEACKKINGGVYPLSISLKNHTWPRADGSCRASSIVATCHSRLSSGATDESSDQGVAR